MRPDNCPSCEARHSRTEGKNRIEFKCGVVIDGKCNRCTHIVPVPFDQEVATYLSSKHGRTSEDASGLVERFKKGVVAGALRDDDVEFAANAVLELEREENDRRKMLQKAMADMQKESE